MRPVPKMGIQIPTVSKKATFVLVLATLLLAACATPQTFNESVRAGYSVVTETRASASTLLNARRMSSADAENVQKQADLAREGLDLARIMRPTDPSGAQEKLSATQKVLTALKAYLLAKEASK